MTLPDFIPFNKIPRLSRNIVITEKIDGTNAQVYVTDDGNVYAGSRHRWLTLAGDNFGFARWVDTHADELITGLGPGRHYGEWWGQGIQRDYGLKEKRFSLFNTARWRDPEVRPECCHVVPVLYQGQFEETWIDWTIQRLTRNGSYAATGFMKPEGIVIFHSAANSMFKKTLENDAMPKSQTKAA